MPFSRKQSQKGGRGPTPRRCVGPRQADDAGWCVVGILGAAALVGLTLAFVARWYHKRVRKKRKDDLEQKKVIAEVHLEAQESQARYSSYTNLNDFREDNHYRLVIPHQTVSIPAVIEVLERQCANKHEEEREDRSSSENEDSNQWIPDADAVPDLESMTTGMTISSMSSGSWSFDDLTSISSSSYLSSSSSSYFSSSSYAGLLNSPTSSLSASSTLSESSFWSDA